MKNWMKIVAVGLLAMAIAGCGGGDKKEAAKPAAKALRMGAEMTFPPFEFQDEKTQQYVGFDIDLMKAIGKEMGMDVEVVSMGFDALIPALQGKNIDVIASGMSITPERAQKVAFSKPYYKSGLTIVVKADNQTIKGFPDLEGKKIGVQIGTTAAAAATKIKGASVREFNATSDAYMELKAGGVDAVVNDLPVNQDYLKKSGGKDAKMVGEIQDAEDYGIAVELNNKELVAKIDKALETLKQNGEYEKIYVKWFGQKPVAK